MLHKKLTTASLRDSALAESWQSIILHFFRDSIVKFSKCLIIDCFTSVRNDGVRVHHKREVKQRQKNTIAKTN